MSIIYARICDGTTRTAGRPCGSAWISSIITLRRRRRQLANEMVEVKQVTSVSLVSVEVTVANKNVVDVLLIRKRLNRFKLFDDNK